MFAQQVAKATATVQPAKVTKMAETAPKPHVAAQAKIAVPVAKKSRPNVAAKSVVAQAVTPPKVAAVAQKVSKPKVAAHASNAPVVKKDMKKPAQVKPQVAKVNAPHTVKKAFLLKVPNQKAQKTEPVRKVVKPSATKATHTKELKKEKTVKFVPAKTASAAVTPPMKAKKAVAKLALAKVAKKDNIFVTGVSRKRAPTIAKAPQPQLSKPIAKVVQLAEKASQSNAGVPVTKLQVAQKAKVVATKVHKVEGNSNSSKV